MQSFDGFEKVTGEEVPLSKATEDEIKEGRIFAKDGLDSQTGNKTSRFPVKYNNIRQIPNGSRGWRTSEKGITKLIKAGRLTIVWAKNSLQEVL